MQGLRPLTRYFEFSGRSGRAEYWQWFALLTVGGWLVQALQSTVEAGAGTPQQIMPLLFACGTFIPQTAVAIRRLHDRGRSGWVYGGLLILLAASLPALIFGRQISDEGGGDTLLGIGFAAIVVWFGGLIMLLVELARPGDPGPNRFGPPDVSEPSGTPERFGSSALDQPRTVDIANIERLARLREQGVLSEAEFTTAKARVLAQAQQVPGASGNIAAAGSSSMQQTSPLRASAHHDPQAADWQPSSRWWQKRFAFYDQYGLRDTPERRQQLQARGERARGISEFNLVGLLLGPFYFLYLGLWRPALVLLAGVVASILLIDPIVARLLPDIDVQSSDYTIVMSVAFALAFAMTAAPLYYLKRRCGVERWNPFRRS